MADLTTPQQQVAAFQAKAQEVSEMLSSPEKIVENSQREIRKRFGFSLSFATLPILTLLAGTGLKKFSAKSGALKGAELRKYQQAEGFGGKAEALFDGVLEGGLGFLAAWASSSLFEPMTNFAADLLGKGSNFLIRQANKKLDKNNQITAVSRDDMHRLIMGSAAISAFQDLDKLIHMALSQFAPVRDVVDAGALLITGDASNNSETLIRKALQENGIGKVLVAGINAGLVVGTIGGAYKNVLEKLPIIGPHMKHFSWLFDLGRANLISDTDILAVSDAFHGPQEDKASRLVDYKPMLDYIAQSSGSDQGNVPVTLARIKRIIKMDIDSTRETDVEDASRFGPTDILKNSQALQRAYAAAGKLASSPGKTLSDEDQVHLANFNRLAMTQAIGIVDSLQKTTAQMAEKGETIRYSRETLSELLEIKHPYTQGLAVNLLIGLLDDSIAETLVKDILKLGNDGIKILRHVDSEHPQVKADSGTQNILDAVTISSAIQLHATEMTEARQPLGLSAEMLMKEVEASNQETQSHTINLLLDMLEPRTALSLVNSIGQQGQDGMDLLKQIHSNHLQITQSATFRHTLTQLLAAPPETAAPASTATRPVETTPAVPASNNVSQPASSSQTTPATEPAAPVRQSRNGYDADAQTVPYVDAQTAPWHMLDYISQRASEHPEDLSVHIRRFASEEDAPYAREDIRELAYRLMPLANPNVSDEQAREAMHSLLAVQSHYRGKGLTDDVLQRFIDTACAVNPTLSERLQNVAPENRTVAAIREGLAPVASPATAAILEADREPSLAPDKIISFNALQDAMRIRQGIRIGTDN